MDTHLIYVTTKGVRVTNWCEAKMTLHRYIKTTEYKYTPDMSTLTADVMRLRK